MKLVKLFESIRIGYMELKNRIVMPAMCTNFASDTGGVTQRMIDYYAERAKGGVGLIITEATCVDSPLGKNMACTLCIDSDKFIPGLNALVGAVHSYGAKIAAQLHHSGRQAPISFTEGMRPVSASDVPCPSGGSARGLTTVEIERIVQKYADAALRAKIAGFDAVEIQGAHGYLVAQFLSPYTNKRTDEYGGDANRRLKFAVEILKSIRGKVGATFPIIFRISGDEFIEGGLTISDTKIIAKRLEEEGVDALHVSVGLYETRPYIVPPMAFPQGCFLHIAEGIKKVVNIPVIAVGRINDPALAEKILIEGKADLCAMGRALLADPELPNKAFHGKFDEINKCIACNKGCSERLLSSLSITCSINPRAGMEREYRVKQASKKKKVFVIGGGPAGMEAAIIAAERGHEVTLFEKDDKLGGQLNLAAVPPHKQEVNNLIEYLISRINKLGINVMLGKEATLPIIEENNPDTLIIATGANPYVPKIAGIDGNNVLLAWDVLREKASLGQKIIVAGGGMVGCETAEYISEKGRDVTIIEMLEDVALDVEFRTRYFLLERLREKKIKILTNLKIIEINSEGVIAMDRWWNKHIIEGENVVLAFGSKADNKLAKVMEGRVREQYTIGDCVKPRRIHDAIHEGFLTALRI